MVAIDDASFGEHGVLEGDHMSSLKSHGVVCFLVMLVICLLISCISSTAMSCSLNGLSLYSYYYFIIKLKNIKVTLSQKAAETLYNNNVTSLQL